MNDDDGYDADEDNNCIYVIILYDILFSVY
jgi:hypothetical protein